MPVNLAMLAGEVDRARLTDHHDLDLPRILELALDATGDRLRDLGDLPVAHLPRLHHDAKLAAGLDGEAALHTGLFHGELFELLQSLDVAFEHLAPCPRPRPTDGVRRGHEEGL